MLRLAFEATGKPWPYRVLQVFCAVTALAPMLAAGCSVLPVLFMAQGWYLGKGWVGVLLWLRAQQLVC